MAMKIVKCPNCKKELMCLPATGGVNQTKSCFNCGTHWRVIQDVRTGKVKVERD